MRQVDQLQRQNEELQCVQMQLLQQQALPEDHKPAKLQWGTPMIEHLTPRPVTEPEPSPDTRKQAADSVTTRLNHQRYNSSCAQLAQAMSVEESTAAPGDDPERLRLRIDDLQQVAAHCRCGSDWVAARSCWRAK